MAETPAAPAPFGGFQPDALQFLADLAANNDRAWFKPRKADYERLIKEPIAALCVALADRFEALGLPLRRRPASARPFASTATCASPRTSRPTRPPREPSFPWRRQRRRLSGPRVPSVATSTWSPATSSSVVACGTPSRRAWRPFARRSTATPTRCSRPSRTTASDSVFGSVTGETLTRNPKGFPQDHPYRTCCGSRTSSSAARLADRDVFSPQLPDIIAHDLDAARPVLRFLRSARRSARTTSTDPRGRRRSSGPLSSAADGQHVLDQPLDVLAVVARVDVAGADGEGIRRCACSRVASGPPGAARRGSARFKRVDALVVLPAGRPVAEAADGQLRLGQQLQLVLGCAPARPPGGRSRCGGGPARACPRRPSP